MTTVHLRTDDGRVLTAQRATAAEAWACVVDAIAEGRDVGGAWQGIRVRDGAVMLVPAACVVEPPRAVTR